MNYLEKIQYFKNTFSKSDKKVCAYIISHPQEVEDITITRIAENAGVSTSAVLRFCQRLGYSGYSEFRYDFLKTYYYAEIEKNTNIMDDYINNYLTAVSELKKIPEEKILETVRLINQAEYINTLGSVNSSLPAMKFYYDFISLGKRVLPLTGALTPWVNASLTKNDLIIIFSATGGIANDSCQDFLTYAQNLGCNIILITCSKKTKISKYATHIIELPYATTSHGNMIEPQSLMMMLVTILAAYAKQDM